MTIMTNIILLFSLYPQLASRSSVQLETEPYMTYMTLSPYQC